MQRYATLVVHLLCCLCSVSVHAADAKDCHLKQLATIQLVPGENGRLLVPVTLDGTAASMVLRTENWFSMIRERHAQRLGLPLKPGPVVMKPSPTSADQRTIQESATVANFLVGETARFKKAQFVVGPNDAESDETIGTLGADFLDALDVELDLANNKMNLYDPDHCPGQVVYWAQSFAQMPMLVGNTGQMYFQMELEGKSIAAIIATGGETTTLPTDVTKALFGFDNTSRDVEVRTGPNGQRTSHYRAMDLTSRGFRIINADIGLTEPISPACRLSKHNGAWQYENCTPTQPLRLGRDVLRKLHVYIAVREKMLYFTRSETPKSDTSDR